MPLFDESTIEASHQRLASFISADIEALQACTDLVRKALLAQDHPRTDINAHRSYLAASMIGFRIVNHAGAATSLLDRGYFAEAVSLMRNIAEIGMQLLDISERPKHLLEWSVAGGFRENRKFRRHELKGRVKDQLKLVYFDKYFDEFSELGTHSSSVTIILHHDGERLQIGPHHNPRLFTLGYRDLSQLVWHASEIGKLAYEKIFGVSPAALFPIEAERFDRTWIGISGPADDKAWAG
ncbi:MAG: hypothetical protein AB7I79_09295 [Rhizobiaceae bacterium]